MMEEIKATDRFTPEAIASIIEQLRKREDIAITEIKDEPDAVKVIGKVRMGDSWDKEKPLEGVICCMMKAEPTLNIGVPLTLDANTVQPLLAINYAIQNQNAKLSLLDKEVIGVALDGTCTFDDVSEIKLTRAQLHELTIQVVQHNALSIFKREPVTFSDQSKQAIARDTQFAGFARLLLKGMEEVSCVTYASQDDFIKAHKLYIAQRAYDFACHIANFVMDGAILPKEVWKLVSKYIMGRIPDMTEWPEEEEVNKS